MNFQNNDFFDYVMGGYAINGKYSKVDLGVSYTYKWQTVGVNNYYYPTITTPEDQYFNFKSHETGHRFESVVMVAPENIPALILGGVTIVTLYKPKLNDFLNKAILELWNEEYQH